MDASDSKKLRGLICLALVCVTVGVYWQVHGFDFVNFDDPDYVTENKFVKGGLTPAGIVWAFMHFHAGNWHPLTWISHMLDCQIFGMHAGGHHLVNAMLHAANAVLLFLLLQRVTGALWRSAIVAGLFALHPLHVESVAWIAERKDVLSTFFGLLALLAYVKYVNESRVQSPESTVWQAWALGGFALSLMAKPMLVTLPFVMLLLDFWPLGRVENVGWRTFISPQFGRLVWEKKWWFVLTGVSSVVTFYAQKAGGAIVSAEHFPFTWRIANAVTSYFDYVLKAFWPERLAVFYPLQQEQPWWVILAAGGFLAVCSMAAVGTMKRWPFLFVGWLWFLGTLVPVIGLVQVGKQAMADRYTYIPLIGLFIVVVWGISELLGRVKAGVIFGAVAAGIALGLFASMTVSQLHYWQNSLALFSHALAVTRDNAPANNNLGTALAALGKREDALAHYAEAVRIEPNSARYQNNFATALARAGQPDAAIEHYLAAIGDDPRFAEAYSNLGALFLAEHRLAEATTNLNEAVQIEPDNADLRSNLGNALLAAGKLDDALLQYSAAVQLDPDNATVRLNAGLAFLKAGKVNEASVQFAAAVRLNPASAEACFELGRQLFLDRRFSDALGQLEEAAKLKPNYTAAQFYQSVVLGEMGRFEEAVAVANQALESSQQQGQTNLAARIQEALEFYKSRRPYRPKGANGN